VCFNSEKNHYDSLILKGDHSVEQVISQLSKLSEIAAHENSSSQKEYDSLTENKIDKLQKKLAKSTKLIQSKDTTIKAKDELIENLQRDIAALQDHIASIHFNNNNPKKKEGRRKCT